MNLKIFGLIVQAVISFFTSASGENKLPVWVSVGLVAFVLLIGAGYLVGDHKKTKRDQTVQKLEKELNEKTELLRKARTIIAQLRAEKMLAKYEQIRKCVKEGIKVSKIREKEIDQEIQKLSKQRAKLQSSGVIKDREDFLRELNSLHLKTRKIKAAPKPSASDSTTLGKGIGSAIKANLTGSRGKDAGSVATPEKAPQKAPPRNRPKPRTLRRKKR